MTEQQKEKAQSAAGKLASEFQNDDIETVSEVFKYVKAWFGSRAFDVLNYMKKSHESIAKDICDVEDVIQKNDLKP